MNDSSIIINGSTKIMAGVIAYFIINATRDIICKWLDNKKEEITFRAKYGNSCDCKCKCKCKNTHKEQLSSSATGVLNTTTAISTASTPEVSNIQVAPVEIVKLTPPVQPPQHSNTKIIDNYSKNQKHN